MKVLLITIPVLFLSSCSGQYQKKESISERVFFHISDKATPAEALEYCRNSDLLEEVKTGGWISYPPLSALPEESPSSFVFDNIPGLEECTGRKGFCTWIRLWDLRTISPSV